MALAIMLLSSAVLLEAHQPPEPTLTFGTTIRIAEAYSVSPGADNGDGCLAAEARLRSGNNTAVSKVVFDAFRGRLRQSNAALDRNPTQTVTNIGKWGLPTPQEWDVTTGADGSVSCTTEPLPPVMCPNGTLPPSCPPKFGSWGGLNPFTSILGMWYPNTTKVTGGLSASYDTYLLVDVKRTLLPNDGCGTSACTMQHCSGCMHDGRACTQCPCDNCIMEVNVTRNYTYNVAKTPQADGSHQLIRYQWTQGIPLTASGASPGVGRDCFIFDWSQDWTADVQDSAFAPPPGVKCAA